MSDSTTGDAQQQQPPRRRRRVVIPPPEGVDLHPESEPDRFDEGDNTERLKKDKPPHY